MVLKLCDFGQARNIDRTEGMTSHLGTPSWTAPEVYAKASRLIYFENFYYVQ
jgi:serine/threonine protein kinase